MRTCHGGQNAQWVVMGIFVAPNAGYTPPDDAETSAFLAVTDPVSSPFSPDACPVAKAPGEEVWPELLAEFWAESYPNPWSAILDETWSESLVEPPLEDMIETNPDLMMVAPLTEDARVEDARVEDARVEDARVEDARVEDARVEDARVEDARVEDARVEDARVEDALRKPWVGTDLVERVLDQCLKDEKNYKPVLMRHQQLKIARLAKAGLLRELGRASSGKGVPDLSISDFKCCSWRWLKLALLMREWQTKDGDFTNFIATLQGFVLRPEGLSDVWFLAGILQRFMTAWSLSNWLPRQLSPQGGWNGRKMIFRVSFPDGVVHLPESKKSINRVCAMSKLVWWLHQAQQTVRIDKETWTDSGWPAALTRVKSNLGEIFDETVQAVKTKFPPPSLSMSNSRYLSCLLKYVDMTPPSQTKIPRPSYTVKKRKCLPDSNPSTSSVDAENISEPVDPDRSVIEEMSGFMASVLEDCAERERKEKIGYPVAGKVHVSRVCFQKFLGVLSSTRKSAERNRDKRISDPFKMCGWRWLCLAGLMNDYLETYEVLQVIADSEKLVARPKDVSLLWYLACRLQSCLRGKDIIAGILDGMKEGDVSSGWWTVSTVIYRDHFPQTFGELPISETSVRLIAFSSRAAHWIAQGIRKLRCTPKTWRRPVSNRDIVDSYHAVLGHGRFNEMIKLVRPKISTITDSPKKLLKLSDKTIMEILLKYTKLDRRIHLEFCRDWLFDTVASKGYKRLSEDEANSSEDEGPAKRVCTK
ncbi:hypothetical protein GNI_012520 [Gregarina niphandrodes]|uniref:Uncharacterized protein n=1 Tax=Gregarina niphandrodes TaxID=110365 RepID=A0A023BCR6_GRENI|nr:hypothetical protein GNI_012520 [Gregarina niphandrodes]EZG84598.1 hypothetical protein GNI_012520 [Gregarina niphandrodes]|eukprot:XP_011128858.1 hypothetical protein GNI_012520 [Gregarina niphandrodes]